MSCTPDRAHCVAESTYIPDVCRLIEAAARESGLDRDFFARLLWKESLFDAAAVSPAGAQGIAQFMPETAKLRGLGDAFNPAEALVASARYLSELSRDLGNIGLAAVAYNGGEARAARFIAAEAGLPLETRAYVRAITGHSAETWRDAPPASVDLALDKGRRLPGRLHRPGRGAQPARVRAAPPSCPGASSSPRTATAPAPSARSRGCRTATPPSCVARRSPTPAAGGRGCRADCTSRRSAAAAAPRPRRSAPGCAPPAATAWC